MTPTKQYTYSDWVQYQFYKESLDDSRKFRHEIDKKLQDRDPQRVDLLKANKAMYDQEIIDMTNALRHYVGIEDQYTLK